MRADRVEQRFVAERGIAQAEFGEGRSLFPQCLAQRQAGALDKLADHAA